MKPLLILFTIVAIVAGILIYSTNSGQKGTGNKKVVLTTFTVLGDMAKNVAGDKLQVESITKPGAEIHGYEPTPNDLVRAQKAQLILDNGMNLEKWAEKLYNNIPDVPHVTLTKDITPIPIAEGPYQDKPNPHAWMSPKNALIYVDNIKNAFIDLDPANKATYEANAEAYKNEIRAIDSTLAGTLGSLPPNRRYLASCEGAFTYLTRDYGLKELYLWPINADAQGSPQQVRSVINVVRSQNIPTVFCESTVNPKAMEQVARETGTRFGGVFYVDSLSGADGPAPTYLQMLSYNATTLINGLK